MAKSQDVLVLLKWLYQEAPRNYVDLAKEFGTSVGEVHGATQRPAEAGLFDLASKWPRVQALKESLIYRFKYAFFCDSRCSDLRNSDFI